MISKELRTILLSKRILREDPFERVWIDEYFSEILEGMQIREMELLICNTLQRRTSYSVVNGKPIIIFDNYLLELFAVLNQLLEDIDGEEKIPLLFYKIAWESFYLNENYQFAAIYKMIAKQKFKQVGNIEVRQISRKSEPRYSYVQQVFLISHEVMHCYFQQSKESYEEQKQIVEELLYRFLGEKFEEIYLNISETYKEEYCCDHLAVYTALHIGIKEYGNSIENSAIAIVLAMYHQFIILCIDKWVQGKLVSVDAKEFEVRMSFIRFFVSNYLKVEYPKIAKEINVKIDEKYNLWKTRYMNQIVRFLINEKKAYPYYKSHYQFQELELEQIKKDIYKSFL